MTEPAITISMLPTERDLAPAVPLQERAWVLYCQGEHPPEIGRLLGVSERTVRYWINRTLRTLDAEHKDLRTYQLDLAIARKRQIIASAYESYERLTLIADDEAAKAAEGDETANPTRARQALAVGARYLNVINSADRDLVRLHAALSYQNEPSTPQPPLIPFPQPTAATDRDATPDGQSPDTVTPSDPATKPTTLDLITPKVISRMTGDGLLDDLSLLTSDEQESEVQNARAAKTATLSVSNPAWPGFVAAGPVARHFSGRGASTGEHAQNARTAKTATSPTQAPPPVRAAYSSRRSRSSPQSPARE